MREDCVVITLVTLDETEYRVLFFKTLKIL